MVLNSKDLKQNSDKRYEQNFDWGISILKGYRQEIEDDNSKLLTFLKDNLDIKQARSKFESDKNKFLDEYYYGKGSKDECSERLEKFLKVVEKDLRSFYIFSKVVINTTYESLLDEFFWNDCTSKFEIKGSLSGVMKKDTEVEVEDYISNLLKSFFVSSDFDDYGVDKGRISCLWKIINDISLLLFRTRMTNFWFKFSFESFNLEVFNHNDFDKNGIHIGELMVNDEREIFNIMIAKHLYFDNLDEDKLLLFFSDELKRKFDQLLSDLLLINSPKFKLEKVESGFVPLFMFTDSQILNCIKEGENTYSFSTIKSIKKMTSEEQFERFMNLLSQI
jgi:hypothetical protein